jgi:porin
MQSVTPHFNVFARSAARDFALCLCLSAPLGAVFSAQAATEAAPEPEQGAAQAWQWAGVLKLDGALTRGRSGGAALGNIGLSADLDADALWGWPHTALHTELLWNAGGKPNHLVDTAQGVDNIEVERAAARLYATWIERQFPESGSRALFGLYDLNTEFYATDASGMLLHPSFGIGSDFSQSGRNGPSIFPNVGLALRLKQRMGDSHYLQAAVIDGVPGNPAHLGRTEIDISREDGVLLVTEFGWQSHDDTGAQPGHWGLGAWHYAARAPRLGGGPPEHNQGAYLVAQALLHEGPQARTTGFLRWGAARSQLNRLASALEWGVLVDKPWGESGPDALTAGIALGRFGAAYRADPTLGGRVAAEHETTVEVGARWPLAEGVSVQPYFQHVLNPGGVSGETARVGGIRFQWNFGSNAN